MRKTFVALSVLLSLGVLEAFASDLDSLLPGGNEIRFEHDGQTRRLIVTTPSDYDRTREYPILFCFHGAGGKADGQSNRWAPKADERSLIVVSAEAIQPMAKWNFLDDFHSANYDDVGFVSRVIETLIKQKVANPNAIFATGHSSGGLFCYRLAKESDLFAALAPMSCGMVKNGHEPDETTQSVPIFQVIGNKDKSYQGSTNPKVTMYSAKQRIGVWSTYNQCDPHPAVEKVGSEILVYTYRSPSGADVVLCDVKDQAHHIRRDLRDRADILALDFLLQRN